LTDLVVDFVENASVLNPGFKLRDSGRRCFFAIARPVGVLRSRASVRETKPTPRSINPRRVTTRSDNDRPQGSSRRTTMTSTWRCRAAFNNDWVPATPSRTRAGFPTRGREVGGPPQCDSRLAEGRPLSSLSDETERTSASSASRIGGCRIIGRDFGGDARQLERGSTQSRSENNASNCP
jgi:hypothetical protein